MPSSSGRLHNVEGSKLWTNKDRFGDFACELSSHISLDYGYNSSVGLCHFGDFHKDMVASVPSGEVYYVGR